MSVVERNLHDLDRISRQRSAQHRHPMDRDIAAVRADLERELGGTVSRRIAARFLGVSHTALGRWIESGDLPVVFSRAGRWDVPVPALLDLHDALSDERGHGGSQGHCLETVFSAGRERALRLNSEDLIAEPERTDNGHGPAELRGLAYHRVLADWLDHRMIAEARHRVWKWRDEGGLDPRYAGAWEEVLDRPLPEIRRLMAEDSARAIDLRQSSPFAGMLSEAERRRIIELVDE